MAKVILINDKEYRNCFESITWSGDYETPYRTLEVEYLREAIPDVQAGDIVNFILDDKFVFRGRIFFTSKSARRTDRGKFTAYDSAVYLVKNKMVENYVKATPSQVVKDVCGKLGLEVGSLPIDNSNAIATVPCLGWDAAKIIKTFYTYQTRADKKNYSIVDYEGRIQVVESGKMSSYMLNSKTNIRSASYDTSIEDMVNKIIIYKSDSDTNANTVVGTRYLGEEGYMIKKYGLFQDVQEYTGDGIVSSLATYDKGLKGPENSGSITCDGSIELMSGYCVGIDVPHEPTITGIFYIKSDTHSWTHNNYETSLELSFEKLENLEDLDAIEAEKRKNAATAVKYGFDEEGNLVIEAKSETMDFYTWVYNFARTNNRKPTEAEQKEYIALMEERKKGE